MALPDLEMCLRVGEYPEPLRLDACLFGVSRGLVSFNKLFDLPGIAVNRFSKPKPRRPGRAVEQGSNCTLLAALVLPCQYHPLPGGRLWAECGGVQEADRAFLWGRSGCQARPGALPPHLWPTAAELKRPRQQLFS